MHLALTIGIGVAAILLTLQSLFSIYLMLYAWEHPQRLGATAGPTHLLPSRLSFTVLLPARHEHAVIAETIRSICAANYPTHLLELVVICHADDFSTIGAATRQIKHLGLPNGHVVTFSSGPINKPRGLNTGFGTTSNEVVVVFDAEDDIHPDIFNVINTVMLEERVGVVQAGVQLMNFRDRWFSIHNCLEYFFWYKSRLHFHAAVGMIPLGGNTIFIRRNLITKVGGWDEACLTEDADIGLRLSALGERIRVVYDSASVTREETPQDVASLIRQRTRWHQGFLQILRRRTWQRLPRPAQQLLALATLAQPILDAGQLCGLPLLLTASLWLKLPVPISLLSFCPLYALVFQMLISVAGSAAFAHEFGESISPLMPARMLLTYIPYQCLLGLGAVRAAIREARGATDWEKTQHVGAHRHGEIMQSKGAHHSLEGDDAVRVVS